MRLIGADLAHKLRSHACRWAGLPEVSVPSAAVDDEQTAAWSADMYDRDLATEPKPRGEETASIVVGMRPRALRRRLGLMFLGALIAGCVLGTGVARADGQISNVESAYIAAYGAGAVCPVIAEYPSTAGVLGVAQGIMDDGFTAGDAVDIINVSVATYCPEYWSLLERIGAEARGETLWRAT